MLQSSANSGGHSINTSDMITGILSEVSTTTIHLGTIFTALNRRSFGGVVMVLSIIGLLPGISVLAGIAIFVLAIQLILGYSTPYLPQFIRQKEVDVEKLRTVIKRPLQQVSRVERYIRPRWLVLTTPAAIRFIGIIIACLALIMITPLPLSNLLPAIAMLFISLGLLEKDGLLIACGLLASLFAMTTGFVVIRIVYNGITQLMT